MAENPGKISRRDALWGVGVLFGGGLGAAYRSLAEHAPRTPLLRPPGAPSEAEFLASCIRCGQCVQACPPEFATLRLAGIEAGRAIGTPVVDARQAPCKLCEGYDRPRCIQACPTDALSPVQNLADIRMGTAVIDEATCLAYNGTVCRTCWHVCPFLNDAIYFDEMLRVVVNENSCIGCGICTHACPTEPTSIPIRPSMASPPSGVGRSIGTSK